MSEVKRTKVKKASRSRIKRQKGIAFDSIKKLPNESDEAYENRITKLKKEHDEAIKKVNSYPGKNERKSKHKYGTSARYQELHHKSTWKGMAQGTDEDVKKRSKQGKKLRSIKWTPDGIK